MDLDAALDELYGVTPDQFTGTRDALARTLRSGDAASQSAGAALKALKKPTVTAWALNQVARRDASGVEALMSADAEVARAQREGAGRDALAQAGAARREVLRRLMDAAAAVLVEAGHPDSPGNRDRIARTLAAVAVDEEGRAALQKGRLAKDLVPGSLWDAPAVADPFGALAASAAAPAPDPAFLARLAELEAAAGAAEESALGAEAVEREAHAAWIETHDAAKVARAAATLAAHDLKAFKESGGA